MLSLLLLLYVVVWKEVARLCGVLADLGQEPHLTLDSKKGLLCV